MREKHSEHRTEETEDTKRERVREREREKSCEVENRREQGDASGGLYLDVGPN